MNIVLHLMTVISYLDAGLSVITFYKQFIFKHAWSDSKNGKTIIM